MEVLVVSLKDSLARGGPNTGMVDVLILCTLRAVLVRNLVYKCL